MHILSMQLISLSLKKFLYLIILKTAHTLFQGLYRASSFIRAGVCFPNTAISSLALVNLFQHTSSSLRCPNPLSPSRVTRWLKLASKYSRLGCKLGKTEKIKYSLSYWLCLFEFELNVIIYCHHSYHVRNIIKPCELIEADGEMPQSCEAGNLPYLTQAVVMEVEYLDKQYHLTLKIIDTASISSSHVKMQNTYSDLTEDIGSGNIKQNSVVQAQQLRLWFQNRFHVDCFLVQDDVVWRSLISVCDMCWDCRLVLILGHHNVWNKWTTKHETNNRQTSWTKCLLLLLMFNVSLMKIVLLLCASRVSCFR